MSKRYIQVENFEIHIVWIQERKGPKCIGMILNIQKFYFSVNSANRFYREELFQITHDLQQMQIQEEHSRIYTNHILCILEGMENQLNTKSHQKHLL